MALVNSASKFATTLWHDPSTSQDAPLPGFLRLPRQVRSKIYLRCGLFVPRYNLRTDLNKLQTRDSRAKYQMKITVDLFLTCKTIYSEASFLVYAFNHFCIWRSPAPSLDPLRRLSASSITAITKLTIHLNATSCVWGGDCELCYRPVRYSIDKHDAAAESLALKNNQSRIRIEEWNRFWSESFRPNLWLGRLTLTFVCDVQDYNTALAVTRPFFADLDQTEPLLAHCSIRLSRRRDDAISKLAEEAVIAATTGKAKSEDSSDSFPFMDLPAELRLEILSYTDIVAPRKEVEWNPSAGGYYVRYLDAYWHPEHSFHLGSEEFPYMPCWNNSYSGCFCRAQHAAYSSEIACNCWTRPSPFFLVNRAFCADAQRVFYSENRFVITPNGEPWEDADRTDRLPASIFLSDVVPKHCLRYLRELEFVFPSLGKIVTYCQPQSREWQDWVRTLNSVADKLNLPNLTIRVLFAEWHPGAGAGHQPYEDDHPVYRQSQDEHEFNLMRQAYVDTITPLQRLRGLRSFFVYLKDPWWHSREYNHWDIELVRDKCGQLKQNMIALTVKLEKVVMGEQYDATAVGRPNKDQSLWTWDYKRYWCEL